MFLPFTLRYKRSTKMLSSARLRLSMTALKKRVFTEHFPLEQETWCAKDHHELSAESLQSPDDLEATYRQKGGPSGLCGQPDQDL